MHRLEDAATNEQGGARAVVDLAVAQQVRCLGGSDGHPLAELHGRCALKDPAAPLLNGAVVVQEHARDGTRSWSIVCSLDERRHPGRWHDGVVVQEKNELSPRGGGASIAPATESGVDGEVDNVGAHDGLRNDLANAHVGSIEHELDFEGGSADGLPERIEAYEQLLGQLPRQDYNTHSGRSLFDERNVTG